MNSERIDPIRLEDDTHLIDTCFEIRFNPVGEGVNEHAAIPSLILSELQKLGKVHLEMTNQSNLPLVVRDETPDLKFAATHRAEVSDYRYMFNEKSISISPIAHYPGWAVFSPTVETMVKTLVELNIIKSVIRIGYRSIDFFPGSMEGKCTLKVKSPLGCVSSAQHFMLCKKKDISIRVGVGENVTITQRSDEPGVMIDVDASMDNDLPATTDGLMQHAKSIHDCCKRTFFSLLEQELIKSKGPIYE
ncbi:MAG: TIGR04255 family protein [Mariprofundales bacterium]